MREGEVLLECRPPVAMSKFVVSRADFGLVRGPGGLLLECGLLLFGMGLIGYLSDQDLLEGPSEQALVRVEAKLLQAKCKVNRGSSIGTATSSMYGEPVVLYEYEYAGQTHASKRYFRQRGTPVGSMAECERLIARLLQVSSIHAWIDPAKPEFAVLSKDLRGRFLIWAFFGLTGSMALLGSFRLLKGRELTAKKGVEP